MRNTALLIIVSLFLLPQNASATFLTLTDEGLDLSQGNYGMSLEIDDVVTVSAVSMIGQSEGPVTGEVYVHESGLGVQLLNGDGSVGISGHGDHQNEELVFNFAQAVYGSSILLGINKYKSSQDDPVITLNTANAQEIVFAESQWTSAIVSQDGEHVLVDFSLLLNEGSDPQQWQTKINRLSVLETSSHIYVDAIGYQITLEPIPEPTTVFTFAFGGSILLSQKRRTR